jgi:hypothetical protein
MPCEHNQETVRGKTEREKEKEEIEGKVYCIIRGISKSILSRNVNLSNKTSITIHDIPLSSNTRNRILSINTIDIIRTSLINRSNISNRIIRLSSCKIHRMLSLSFLNIDIVFTA